MHKWNKVDPYNLEYIEKQVKDIKAKHNITNNDEKTEGENTREVTEILEEQLIILKEMQNVLERIEAVTLKKGWKRFL